MTNVLSVYYSPHHRRDGDDEYLRKLDPAWVRIHQPSAVSIEQVQRTTQAKIMLRSWDIDDSNGDRKAEAYSNPTKAAQAHMDMWADFLLKLQSDARNNGWNLDQNRFWLGLINEPDPSYLPQIVSYTKECLQIANSRNWKLGVGVSSVGTFPKPGEGQNTWDLFKPLESIIRNGNHVLIVHEYWQPEGPSFTWTDLQGNQRVDAGNLSWRHHSIPLNVPILIGESGANGYIFGRHSQQDDAGWKKFMSAEQYANQVDEYIVGCDNRVEGVCLYMTDYHSPQWESFDTYPARQQLISIRYAKPEKIFYSGKNPPSISAPDGLHVRKGPGIYFEIIGYLKDKAEVKIESKIDGGSWLQISMPMSGWINSGFVLNIPEDIPIVNPDISIPVTNIQYPVKSNSKISQYFGENPQIYKQFVVCGVPLKGHNGVDFAVLENTPIVATDDGKVTEVGNSASEGYGKWIKIIHKWGESLYAHLNEHGVVLDQKVKAGQQIGLSGNTGFSTGPHLHFGLKFFPYLCNDGFGGYSDPMPYLNQQQDSMFNKQQIIKMIHEIAPKFNLDPFLIQSQCFAESSFNVQARSTSGAMGLMQIMPATWNEWAPIVNAKSPWNPEDNLKTGCAYMKWLIEKNNKDIKNSLICYVWGIGNFQSGKQIPEIANLYSEKIIHGYELLKTSQ